MKYDLAYSTFGKEEKKAIEELVAEDQFTMGRHVAEFESQFAQKWGRKYAAMVNSGSSANLIAVAALFFRKDNPLKRGDEVIVPCISWATTFHPLQQYGLKCRFVDVDPLTLNINPDELAKALTSRTRMVVAVSILGNPCDFRPITEFCRTHNLLLFEDNCESMGAKYNGKYTGTFGHISTFSTFFSHHISTMEGGVILTDDFELYCLCRSLRNHGWTRDQPQDSPIFKKKPDDFFEAYRFILPGYNVRPGEIHGLLGKVQLKKLDGFIQKRRQNAEHFQNLFRSSLVFTIQHETGESSWFSFTFVLKPEYKEKRAEILSGLKAADINYRIITGGCFLRHDAVQYFDYDIVSSNNAMYAHDYGFFIGNGPVDLRKNIDYVHKILSGY